MLLGLTGPPGAGKSTLAGRLATALPHSAAVSMDGFHIGDAELVRQGLRGIKGAPQTFDRAGFAHLLVRLKTADGPVYVPVFHREFEDSIAAAAKVAPDIELVIVEGNYLLLWPEVATLLDEVWYLDPPPADRVRGLVDRHMSHGKSLADATAWVHNNDERNTQLVADSRGLADLVIGWTAD